MAVTWKKLSYSDHLHTNATTSVSGFMSATDKTKLDGIASGATNYSHPTGDGNLHVPANSTTNSGNVLTAGAVAGTYTWETILSTSISDGDLTHAPNGNAIYDALAGKDNYHGIEIVGSLSFNSTDHTLTIAASVNTYWYNGVKYTTFSSITCDLDLTADRDNTSSTLTANTLYYFYFKDATGKLYWSDVFWNLKTTVPVATVYWNGTSGAVNRETHGYDRNIDWHIWAHSTIGARYGSGLDKTYPTTTVDGSLQIESGTIYDEDLYITTGQQTTIRGWYKVSANVYTFADYSLPYLGTTGAPVFLNTTAYTLDTFAANRYVCYWVFATTDINRPIQIIPTHATTPYTQVSDARAELPPSISSLNPEWKLIYRFIYGGDGQFQESIDYRLQTSLAGGVSTSTTAGAVSFNPSGSISATTVQKAIEELDTEKYVHPTGDGNLHVPANGTTNAGKVLTATASAGVYTWQASTASGTGSGMTAEEVNTLLVNRELTQAIFTPVSWESAPYIAATTDLDPDSYNFMIMWVGKLDEWVLGSDRALFTKEQLISGSDLVFGIKSTSGQLFLDLIGNHWTESDGGLSFSDSLYHCLAVTYDVGVTQTTVKFFVDGYQFGNDQVFNNVGAISPAGKLYISGYSWATIIQMTSKVYYYNRAPSSDEMLSIYLLGVDPADTGSNKTSLGNYSSLVQGKRYRIASYVSNDDFSYVGAANVTGTEFIAVEEWPTHWEHGSAVTRIGALLQLEPAGIFLSHWADFTGVYSIVYPPNIEFTKRTAFDDVVSSSQLFGDSATAGVSEYSAHRDHKHGIPIVDSLIFTCTAGDDLYTNDLVFIATPFTDLTAGRAYKCDNRNIYRSIKSYVAGFVKSNSSVGTSVTIQRTGVVSGFTNLTTGKPQYIGESGGLSEISSNNSLIVGISISPTQMLIALTAMVENLITWYPKGYSMGGYSSAAVATTDKITYSTDITAAQASGNLSTVRHLSAGVSDYNQASIL